MLSILWDSVLDVRASYVLWNIKREIKRKIKKKLKMVVNTKQNLEIIQKLIKDVLDGAIDKGHMSTEEPVNVKVHLCQ